MYSNLQKILSQVERAYKNTVESQSKTVERGEAFNVFNVIGLWSEEVRLHSAMIKELLDPSGSHSCSDQFLRLFFEEVYKIDIPEGVSLAKAIVESEYYIAPISDDKKEGGRIDIFVDVPEELNLPSLIIENKIYAFDQENQLLRYFNFGNKKNQVKLTYLTLDGKEPSEFSTGECSSVNPFCISYKDHIINWLQSCAQIAFEKPRVRETIIQYIDLLKQITEYTMNNNDEIVKIVASSNENLISGLQICARRTDIIKAAVIGPITGVLTDVAKKAETENIKIKFVPDDDFGYRGNKIDWGFRFLIKSSIDNQQVCLKYNFNSWDLGNLYYGIDKAQTTVGVQAIEVFDCHSAEWPWGWNWMPEKYKSWDCRCICEILEDINEKGAVSNFEREILNAIKKASELLKVTNIDLATS